MGARRKSEEFHQPPVCAMTAWFKMRIRFQVPTSHKKKKKKHAVWKALFARPLGFEARMSIKLQVLSFYFVGFRGSQMIGLRVGSRAASSFYEREMGMITGRIIDADQHPLTHTNNTQSLDHTREIVAPLAAAWKNCYQSKSSLFHYCITGGLMNWVQWCIPSALGAS